MPVSGSDNLGNFLDTGTNTPITPRANVEVEVHQVTEVDSGSKILPLQLSQTHQPHRHASSTR